MKRWRRKVAGMRGQTQRGAPHDESLGVGGVRRAGAACRRARAGAGRHDGSERERVAGAGGPRRIDVAPPYGSLEKLAAVAGWIWRGAAEQLSIDGRFTVGVMELHAVVVPGFAGASCADEAFGDCGALVASAAVDRSGVDGRVCGRLAFEANAVGEHAALLFTVPDFPVAVSH